jgi:3-hydroxy-5-methyl-1-naphthoate 3-O-methyltransferase
MVTERWIDLLRGYLPAAAFTAALELGLVWYLAEVPRSVDAVAQAFDIPRRRCRIWLELLVGLDLLERHGETYALSNRARSEILDTYSQATWRYLAQEARERDLAGHDLALHLDYPGSVWQAQGTDTPDYVAQMAEDPDRARQFVRASYELSHAAAEALSASLDLRDAVRLLDLGGGSGVMSLALLRRYPALTATVVDLAPVCAAGREIAEQEPEGKRLSFYPADFLRDDLPDGFDVVLACKLGVYGAPVYGIAARSLVPGGRLIIVDKFVGEGAGEPLSGLIYAFLSSLQDPEFYLISVEEIRTRLSRVGFHVDAVRCLLTSETVVEAHTGA